MPKMRKDATFQLDVTGGAVILQNMMRYQMTHAAEAIAMRGTQILNANNVTHSHSMLSRTDVGAPNKRGGQRSYGQAYINLESWRIKQARETLKANEGALKAAARKAIK